jgi:hypothetical protein
MIFQRSRDRDALLLAAGGEVDQTLRGSALRHGQLFLSAHRQQNDSPRERQGARDRRKGNIVRFLAGNVDRSDVHNLLGSGVCNASHTNPTRPSTIKMMPIVLFMRSVWKKKHVYDRECGTTPCNDINDSRLELLSL